MCSFFERFLRPDGGGSVLRKEGFMENRFWKKAAAASGRSHHAESTRAGAARRACFMLALVVLVCAALTAWPTAARAARSPSTAAK